MHHKQEHGLDGDLFVFPTNMFGYIRMMSQFAVGYTYVGYAIIYVICVLFILFFTFTYLRRVVYVAFLTMIAPLVALTYPIDKINDGSAQAFNSWLKEYIFNLLIQPMHMILYYILISSSFQLASENFLYAIVAICFMVPAEKIVRKFFGFDKAQTPGLLAGAGGAALAMSGLRGLNKFARGGKGPGERGGDKDGKKDDKGPKFKQTGTFDDLAEEDEGGSGNNQGEQQGGDGHSRDEVLEQYNEQGYGQNAEGEYYNPLTDKYDSHNDSSYQAQQQAQPEETDDTSENQSETNEIDTEDSMYSGVEPKRKRVSKARAIARVAGRRTWSGSKRLVGYAARTGTKVAGAAVVGMAGGIIGAATGDVKTVVSSVATGGAIGSAIGTRAANEIGGMKNKVKSYAQGVRKEIANETNNDDERNRIASKLFMKDKEARKIYEQELGIKGPNKKEQIDKAMKSALEYKKYGVNNDKIIAQAMREKGLGADVTDKKRIMAAKIAEKVNGSQKTLDDQMKALKERKNYSQDQIDRLRKAVANIDGNVT